MLDDHEAFELPHGDGAPATCNGAPAIVELHHCWHVRASIAGAPALPID